MRDQAVEPGAAEGRYIPGAGRPDEPAAGVEHVTGDLADPVGEVGGVNGHTVPIPPTTKETAIGETAGSGAVRPVDAPVTEPPSRRRFIRTHLPFGLVLLVAAAAVVRLVEYHWRQGSALLGVALVLAGVLRALVPEERTGLLAVRGRAVDTLSYAGLGGCMLFVALTIQGGPFG